MRTSEGQEIDPAGILSYHVGGSLGSAHRLDRALKPTIHLLVTGRVRDRSNKRNRGSETGRLPACFVTP